MTTCVLHSDRPAYTTIVQIWACRECSEKYEEEGRRHNNDRTVHRKFFAEFLAAARKANHPKATQYTYSGY